MPDKVERLHIICYKWGTLYPAEEVNILRAMVARNLTVPHEFHCITDDASGLDEGIIAHPLPEFGFSGNWRKLHTFSDNFLGLNGEYVVSLDIDLVIIDNIDFLAERPECDFIIARHGWSKTVRAHGAVYRIKVGSNVRVWEDFIPDPERSITENQYRDRMTGEQNWLERKFEHFDFFPAGKIVSFKHDCGARSWKLFGSRGATLGITTAHFGVARAPEGAAIVSFHGTPLPRDVMHSRHRHNKRAPFVAEHWRK